VATLRWTAEAERWLGRIFAYIAKDNAAAVARTVLAIYEPQKYLGSFMEWVIVIPLVLTGTSRILLFGHYRIAYLIKPDHDIDILGVFHSAMEIEHYLS
jgi:plasmid stabilization system protein ParE